MPRKLKLDYLKSELLSINSLIDIAIKMEDIAAEVQYAQRKNEIENQIVSFEASKDKHANVILFFGGRPVFGSKGILASFAGKALDSFQEIISKQCAVNELGSLGERGKIPLIGNSNLNITGIAHGSFGFILEEINEQEPLLDTSLKEIVDNVIAIIDGICDPDDEQFLKATESLDNRTVLALKAFFSNLESQGANMRIVNDNTEYVFDENAIHRARFRIDATEIEDTETEMEGVLKGFLPRKRWFEFKSDAGLYIDGTTTDKAADQYDRLLDQSHQIVEKSCSIVVRDRLIKARNFASKHVYRLVKFSKVDETRLDD